MNKKGQKGKSPSLLVIAGLLIAAYFIFGGSFGGDKASDNTEETVVDCPGIDQVAFDPKMTRLGVRGTTISSDTFYILTDNLGAATSSTNVAPAKSYDVLFGENSTTYYTVFDTVEIGCKRQAPEIELPHVDTTLAIFRSDNDDDGDENTVTNAQAMGASDEIGFTLVMKGSTDDYWGNPNSDCENIAVLEYDKTYFTKVKSDKMTTVPTFFKEHNSSNDGAAAFVIPKVAGTDTVEVPYSVESTSTDPSNTIMVLHIFDCDYDKDADTLAVIEGVEDEDYNMLSLANHSDNIYVS